MIGKTNACYNCTLFNVTGYATGIYKLGYCTKESLSLDTGWCISTVGWNTTPCIEYVENSTATDEFTNEGNIIES